MARSRSERLKKAIEVDPTRAVVDYNKILREERTKRSHSSIPGTLDGKEG
jgi:hypothetical protein